MTRKKISLNQPNPLPFVGFILFILGILIILGGHYFQEEAFKIALLIKELWANAGSELLSIALTVLIIDRLNDRRINNQEKSRLLLQMGSPDSSVSQEAIRQLRAHGWLRDGSLKGLNLRWANLTRGYLWNADLRGAQFHMSKLENVYLTKANLTGAVDLTDDQLSQSRNMRNALMPNGTRYNGRYNLAGDFALAEREGVDIYSQKAMADFYGVSLAEYQQGQEWAKNNLPSETNKPPSPKELAKLQEDEEKIPKD